MLMVPTSTSASVFSLWCHLLLIKYFSWSDSAVQVFSFSLSHSKAGDLYFLSFFSSRGCTDWIKGGSRSVGRVAFSRSRMWGLTFRRPCAFRSLRSADDTLSVFKPAWPSPSPSSSDPRPHAPFSLAVAPRRSPAAPTQQSLWEGDEDVKWLRAPEIRTCRRPVKWAGTWKNHRRDVPRLAANFTIIINFSLYSDIIGPTISADTPTATGFFSLYLFHSHSLSFYSSFFPRRR